jgi:beta-galactosidase
MEQIKGKKLYHGAAFYPELWDDKTIEQDIRLMKETGINVARIGEFAWANMEPEEDKINISFFVNVINRLYENGIETIMCTPTPTPPIWVSHNHPERMYVDENGRIMGHGSRQHACTNNSYFRKRAAIITEHIAKAVGKLPGVIGWQIDNEFKAHVGECMCESCKNLWHEWLKHKYETVENLNNSWGTQIWSEYYNSFEQVPQPGPVPFLHNSSLSTMYRIFSMDKLAEFSNEQADIIRRYSKAPITHNGSFGFMLDNEKLYKNLDFAAYDTYASAENYTAYISNCDFWRNLKRGKDFWVMETSPSFSASLVGYAVPHPNGYLKAEAAAAYALGGEGFCYWLWRQQRSGCEQTHGSIISTWGEPTIGYENVLEVEKARKELEPIIITTRPAQAEVAVTYSDRGKAFIITESHKKLNYRNLTGNFHRILLEAGFHRDLIPEGLELEGYKLLFSPFIHYLSQEYIDRAKAFVEKGGIWIVGPLSGDRTENHTFHTDAALGQIEAIAGIKTLYTYPMDGTNSVGVAFGKEAPLELWSSVFRAMDAKVMGIIKGGVTPDKAFITEKAVGKGKIVMLGSMPAGEAGEELLKALVKHYAEEVDVKLKTDVSKGTIVAPRKEDKEDIWIIINMDGKGGSVTIPQNAQDIISGLKLPQGKLNIGKYEYRVIKFV